MSNDLSDLSPQDVATYIKALDAVTELIDRKANQPHRTKEELDMLIYSYGMVKLLRLELARSEQARIAAEDRAFLKGLPAEAAEQLAKDRAKHVPNS
jgi:hypothetical protein